MIVATGLILTIIFLVGILCYRKHIGSGKVYFGMLLFMSIPSLINRPFLQGYVFCSQNQTLTCLLGFLLLLGFNPWYIFNKYVESKSKCVIDINNLYLNKIKWYLKILIVLSICSMAYQIPYALRNMSLGAAAVRTSQIGQAVIEGGIMTTLSVGISALNIYCILFYFISLVSPKLKKFRFWLLACSFSNIIGSLVFAGRDQLIVFIVFFITFYLIFRSHLTRQVRGRLGKVIISSCSVIVIMLFVISSDRFGDLGEALESGTVGYIAEQPYVFNAQIENSYEMGTDRRFPILNEVYGVKEKWDPSVMQNPYEWQFSTMYGEFFAIGASMWSLFVYSTNFVGYYSLTMKRITKQNNILGAFLMFTVYLYICITGLFYIKAGGSVLTNIFYIALSIIPFFFKGWMVLRIKE